MKNNRALILKTLALTRQATVNKLADQLDINPITVRHHLLILEDQGLIKAIERRHGVGRPHLVYYLTNQGQEEISLSYLHLTDKLLSSIGQNYGNEALVNLLQRIGTDEALAHNLSPDSNHTEFMDNFCEILSERGYQVDWEIRNNRVFIRNASCPFSQLKQSHPEICSLDLAYFSAILRKDLRLESGNGHPDSSCLYSYEV